MIVTYRVMQADGEEETCEVEVGMSTVKIEMAGDKDVVITSPNDNKVSSYALSASTRSAQTGGSRDGCSHAR